MKVYVCKTCFSTLYKCSDTRKYECKDCRIKVNRCSISQSQICDRIIPEKERKIVAEAVE